MRCVVSLTKAEALNMHIGNVNRNMNNRKSRTKLVPNAFQKTKLTHSRWISKKLILSLVLLLALGFDFSQNGKCCIIVNNALGSTFNSKF